MPVSGLTMTISSNEYDNYVIVISQPRSTHVPHGEFSEVTAVEIYQVREMLFLVSFRESCVCCKSCKCQ